MVSVNPTEWGPSFWERTYGYATFEAFSADALPLLDGVGLGPIRPPTEVLLRSAWYAPGGGIGVYVAGRLAAAPTGSEPSPFAAWALAQLQAINTEQENTVATLVIPNAFQVSIEMEAGGQDIVNVIGVTSASGTALGAAGAVKAAWENASGPLKALIPSVAVRNYRAVDLSSVFGDIADVPSTAVGTSTAGTGFSTLAAAALIQWNGASRSRSTRGRMYLGPLGEGDINPDGRTLVSGRQSLFGVYANTLISSLATAGYPLAVLSRKNLQAYPVSSVAVSSIVSTQRRRLR